MHGIAFLNGLLGNSILPRLSQPCKKATANPLLFWEIRDYCPRLFFYIYYSTKKRHYENAIKLFICSTCTKNKLKITNFTFLYKLFLPKSYDLLCLL